MSQWQELELNSARNDGTKLYIDVESRGRRTDVGVLDSLPFDKVTSIVTEISHSLIKAIEHAGPTKSTIELGLEFGIENGSMVALIAKGSGKANFKIIMEWEKGAS